MENHRKRTHAKTGDAKKLLPNGTHKRAKTLNDNNHLWKSMCNATSDAKNALEVSRLSDIPDVNDTLDASNTFNALDDKVKQDMTCISLAMIALFITVSPRDPVSLGDVIM